MMKKILCISLLAAFVISCNNQQKTEEQESRERDSIAEIQKIINQKFVDSIEAAERMHEEQHNHEHDHSDSSDHHH